MTTKRDVSFLPPEYQAKAQTLSDEQYSMLLFEWGSGMSCLCGNTVPAGNFWMSNEWDNCMKILEDAK